MIEAASHSLLDLLPAVTPGPGDVLAQAGDCRVRLASTEEDRRALYRLRFLIFNIELNEGLDSAYLDGEDKDAFDLYCDHLMVEDMESGHIVGTYRLQTGRNASNCVGYYSAQEFEFAPYEALRDKIVELGRACIHRDYRSFEVLNLLWRGIAQYAVRHGGRYLLGCSSVTSQDPYVGSDIYHHLQTWVAPAELQTNPTPEYAFPLSGASKHPPKIPRLLRAYLAIGAMIGGPPALDRHFKTIDFLTILDLEKLTPSARARYLR